MTNEEPETVYVIAHAHDKEIKDMDDVDTVFITAKMPSGILCHIELGRDARYGYDQSVEIFGEFGKAISGGQRITAWEYWDKVRPSQDSSQDPVNPRLSRLNKGATGGISCKTKVGLLRVELFQKCFAQRGRIWLLNPKITLEFRGRSVRKLEHI